MFASRQTENAGRRRILPKTARRKPLSGKDIGPAGPNHCMLQAGDRFDVQF